MHIRKQHVKWEKLFVEIQNSFLKTGKAGLNSDKTLFLMNGKVYLCVRKSKAMQF